MSDTSAVVHGLKLEGDRLEVNGILSIINYSEREVSFGIEERKITISGEDLICDRLDVEHHVAVLRGRISGIKYSGSSAGGGLIRKLIK